MSLSPTFSKTRCKESNDGVAIGRVSFDGGDKLTSADKFPLRIAEGGDKIPSLNFPVPHAGGQQNSAEEK